MLDIIGEGMTIASADNPIRFTDGTVDYFADRHWHVQDAAQWTEAPTSQHNHIEYMLGKGMFENTALNPSNEPLAAPDTEPLDSQARARSIDL